ncbi:MAG: DUF6502 family protein [Gammaproteobacteria bacterium]
MSREAKHQQTEYIALLSSMFDFLLTSGMDVKSIRAIVDRAFAETGEQNIRPRKRDFGLATAGRVLDTWHRSRKYTDNNAEPKAIPLLGKAPSVEALVRSESLRSESAQFARRLKSLGFLVRSGRNRYKPAARIAVVAGLNPLIREYVARSSATLLGTIRQNVSKSARSRKLIERFAEVPDLPSGCEAAFRKFSHEQGWAMLRTMNDWLESRRVRRKSDGDGQTVRAGVHLYAYVDPVRRTTPRTAIR